jgi:hypothetical protein
MRPNLSLAPKSPEMEGDHHGKSRDERVVEPLDMVKMLQKMPGTCREGRCRVMEGRTGLLLRPITPPPHVSMVRVTRLQALRISPGTFR